MSKSTIVRSNNCNLQEVASTEEGTFWFKDSNKQKLLNLRGNLLNNNKISNIVLSTDAQYILSASGNTCFLLDVAANEIISTYNHHTDQIVSLALSRDNKLALTSGNDKKVFLTDALSGKLLAEIEGHTDVINDVGFSECGKQIYTAGKDGLARLYEVDKTFLLLNLYDGKWLQKISLIQTQKGDGEWIFYQGHQDQIFSILMSQSKKYILTGGRDKKAILWDTFNGNKLVEQNGHNDIITNVAFSPDEKMVLSSSVDGNTYVYETKSGNLIQTLKGHEGPIWSMAMFQQDGNNQCHSRHNYEQVSDCETNQNKMMDTIKKQWRYMSQDLIKSIFRNQIKKCQTGRQE